MNMLSFKAQIGKHQQYLENFGNPIRSSYRWARRYNQATSKPHIDQASMGPDGG